MATVLLGESMKPLAATLLRGPTRTALRVCDSRVVERTITGVSNASEISNASLMKSCASCASDGSSTGTPAKRANRRVSCSFCEE